MIKRIKLLQIHLYAASFFAPFLLVMAITGTCYLLDIKGSEEKVFVKDLMLQSAPDEVIVKNILAKIEPRYEFAYIKKSGSRVFTRPTTRTYYSFENENNVYKVYQIKPSLLKALIEVHKGHGPKTMRVFQILLGIALVIILITGIWIALITIRDRKITLIAMGIGSLSFLILF